MATEANEELSDFLYAIFVAIGKYMIICISFSKHLNIYIYIYPSYLFIYHIISIYPSINILSMHKFISQFIYLYLFFIYD